MSQAYRRSTDLVEFYWRAAFPQIDFDDPRRGVPRVGRAPAQMIAMGPAVGALLTLAAASAGDTGLGDCQKLGSRYRVVVATVTDALSAYEKCVAESLGRADCSGEFGELELAQDPV